jgi:hypothetical protein
VEKFSPSHIIWLFLFSLISSLLFYNTFSNPSLPLLLPSSPPYLLIASKILVLSSSRLTRLQLIQVPSTDRKGALVLIHALPEVIDIGRTSARGALLARVLSLLLLVLHARLDGRSGRLSTAAAAEETADRVADGGAYCYTTKFGKIVSARGEDGGWISGGREESGLTLQCWPFVRIIRILRPRRGLVAAGWVRQLVERRRVAAEGRRRWRLVGFVAVLGRAREARRGGRDHGIGGAFSLNLMCV